MPGLGVSTSTYAGETAEESGEALLGHIPSATSFAIETCGEGVLQFAFQLIMR